jgi:iron complex transport system substrate-binding protein
MRTKAALLTLLLVVGVVAQPVAAGAAPAATVGGQDGQRYDYQTGCSFPFSATDAMGTEVTVDAEPERIVTLAPSAAQTLHEFGAFDKVVGVSNNADYLDGYEDKTVVRQGFTVENEEIVGLEPDVVLAPNVVSNDTVESLRNSGLTVFKFEGAGNFSDVYDKTELIGSLTGECAAAEETVTDMQERVTAIREAVADEDRPGALYTFFEFTTGSDTFIHSILTTAGTDNVAAEVGITGFTTEALNPEVVANNSEDIEWLIFNSNPASRPTSDVYNDTAAVRNNQTVVLNEDYLNQPAPRTVLALENLTRAVHPEAYREVQIALGEATPTPTATTAATPGGTEDVTPTATAAPTATDGDTSTATPADTATASPTEAMTEEPTETAAPETTSGSGPGFAVTTSVLALLAGALLARRH